MHLSIRLLIQTKWYDRVEFCVEQCVGGIRTDQLVPKCSDGHYISASLLLLLLVGPHQIWLQNHGDGRDGDLM